MVVKRRNNLELTRLLDDKLDRGSTRVGTERFNLLDNVETFGNFTKDNVLAIEPRAGNSGDEELGTVGVRTSVGHGKKTRLGVTVGKVLVRESFTVDGLATGTVTSGEVTTLEHKVGDDTVERRTGITETLFASAESTEVLGGLGDNIVVELEDNAAKGLA